MASQGACIVALQKTSFDDGSPGDRGVLVLVVASDWPTCQLIDADLETLPISSVGLNPAAAPAVSGYARLACNRRGTACATRPEWQADESFPGMAPSSVWAVTRQRWHVTTPIRRLADGFDHGRRA